MRRRAEGLILNRTFSSIEDCYSAASGQSCQGANLGFLHPLCTTPFSASHCGLFGTRTIPNSDSSSTPSRDPTRWLQRSVSPACLPPDIRKIEILCDQERLGGLRGAPRPRRLDRSVTLRERYAPGTHAGLLLVRLLRPDRNALFERDSTVFQTENVEKWTGQQKHRRGDVLSSVVAACRYARTRGRSHPVTGSRSPFDSRSARLP